MAKSDYQLCHASMSVCLPVLNDSAPTERRLMKFDILSRCRKSFEKILTTITCTLHEDQYTFTIISRSVLLRMKHVSYKRCRENQNTHFLKNFFSKIVLFYVANHCRAGQDTDENMVRLMRCTCWIPKATNTYIDYVIFTAFPLHHCLH